MARPPKPWWNNATQEYNVVIRGVRHQLGPDKEEADRQFHSLMSKPPEERVSPDSVAAVIDEFLDYLEKHREPRTKEWYQRHCQSFIDWLKSEGQIRMPVAGLRPLHVRKWLDSHSDWSDATKNGAARAVQRAFRFAAKEGQISFNPIAYVDKPTPGRRENVISDEHYKLMLDKDASWVDVCTFAWETGARPQEVMRIESRHCEFSNHRIIFPQKEAKGKKRVRIICLTESAEAICKRRALTFPDGPIFRNRSKRPWTMYSVNCRFCRLEETLGKKYALVDFRHTFATRLLKAGVDPITVATLLGHVDTSMLAKQYQHVSQDSEHLMKALKKGVG